jgi:hypothetical protein
MPYARKHASNGLFFCYLLWHGVHGQTHVKLSSCLVCPVLFFAQYTTRLPPAGPTRPLLVPHATAMPSPPLPPHPGTATPTARDPNLSSGNHKEPRHAWCLDSHPRLHTRTTHPYTGALPTYAQPTPNGHWALGVAPPAPLAPRSHTATPTACESNLPRQWQPRHV